MKTKNDIHVKLWAGIGIDTWYHSLSIVLQHILAQGRIRYRAGHRHAIRKFLLVHSRSSQGSQLLIAAIVCSMGVHVCMPGPGVLVHTVRGLGVFDFLPWHGMAHERENRKYVVCVSEGRKKGSHCYPLNSNYRRAQKNVRVRCERHWRRYIADGPARVRGVFERSHCSRWSLC